jgi:hypothetical protein
MPAVSRVLVLAAYAVDQIVFWALVAMVASLALLPRDVPPVTCASSSASHDLLPAVTARSGDSQECR